MKNSKMVLVETHDDLKSITSRKTVIGGGQLVFATMHARVEPPKGFVAQRPREAALGLMASFKKDTPRVYIHVHPALIGMEKKARFALLVDSYLAWGTSWARHARAQTKGVVAVIGGVEQEGRQCHVDVLVFDEGRLVALYDQELPERGDFRFQAGAEAVVAKIRSDYPGVKIKQAAPLSDWGLGGVEYIGEAGLGGLKYAPITRSLNSHMEFVVPAVVAAIGIVYNFGAIGLAWNDWGSAKVGFSEAVNDPALRETGGIDSAYIDVMNQRRIFMEAPRKQDVLPNKVLQIVRGIGVLPGVQIIELRLPAPSVSVTVPGQSAAAPIINADGGKKHDLITSDRGADAQIRISMPKSAASAIDQAREVLGQLAGGTGMSLRLTQDGVAEDKDRRVFTIEGFLHG